MGLWSELLLNPIVIITALVIGTLGEVAKRLVRAKETDKGWKRVYLATLPAHPVVVGALIGLLPWFPCPGALEKEGYEFAGRLGTGLLAGVVCQIGYDVIVSTAKRLIAGGRAPASVPPPPPPKDDEDEDAEKEGK